MPARPRSASAISSWSAQFPPDQAPERFAAIHAAYAGVARPGPAAARPALHVRDQERLVRGDRGRSARAGCATSGFRSKPCCPWRTHHERPRSTSKPSSNGSADWLEHARPSRPRPRTSSSPGSDSEQEPPPREFGIIDLVEEFTALRHELKLQTKSGRGSDRADREHGRGAAAGDRAVPVRRAQGGPGRLDGGQGAGRSPRRPRRGPRPRPA